MRQIMILFLLLSLAPPAFADDKFDPEAHAKAVAPYLDDQTIAVAHLDVQRFDPEALAGRLAKVMKVPAASLEKEAKGLAALRKQFLDAGGRHVYLVFDLTDLPESFLLIAPLARTVEDSSPMHHVLQGGLGLKSSQDSAVMLAAPKEATLKRIRTPRAARLEVAKVFAAAGDGVAQVLIVPPETLRRAIDESIPNLPAEVGGGPSSKLTRGLSWALMTVSADPGLQARFVIQAKDADAATALRGVVDRLVAEAGKNAQVRRRLPRFEAAARLLKPELSDDHRLRLTLKDDEEAIVALLHDLHQAGRSAADSNRSINHLKQIGLALHNYHDVHASFPASAHFSKEGKPLLSWRVLLLPYLGEEKLYKEFHLDEPWDSEHNHKLIAKMPDIFRIPGMKAAEGHTGYVGVVGKDTMFTGAPKGVAIREVTDGTSNTIFVLEADDEHAVEWTKPADLKFDEKAPLAGVRREGDGGFVTLFVDGSVRVVRKADPKVLRALLTRNGGEVVELP